MPLTAGTLLGPYEIVSPLGAGGMGEVYKATDTRLNRAVAIKILPAHVSAQEEMKARFDREAQTIAGLNHPNICTLHDVGHERPSGQGDGAAAISFLVLEHLEGETVADRLARGPMPLSEALTAGIAIADALDKAHRQGVVHRDLKPANVMLTKNGPKLLDFGLAKWISGDADQIAAMPTRADVTAKGTMLGTLQYMAPEQIEGKDADARTDIFGFGTLLYEMVTGKPAFEGKTQATLISAIMSREPRPMSHLLPVAPAALEHVVERCLAKDPDDRWQSAHSLIVQLRWIAYGDARTGVAPPVSAEDRRRQRIAVLLLGLATVLVATLAVPAYLFFQGPDPGEPFNYRVPVRGLEGTDLSMAPDGSGFVFVSQPMQTGSTSLYYRPTGGLTAVKLDGTDDASEPFWATDSRFVAFVAGGQLKKIDVKGGRPQNLGPVAEFIGGTWNKGVILFGSSKGVFRISAEGGQPEAVTTVDGSVTGHAHPSFLPDGVHFVFLALSDDPAQRALYVGSLTSSDRTRLLPLESKAVYAPGHLLYQREGAVYAHPFEAGSRALSGEPTRIAGPARFDGAGGRAAFDVSQTGVLLYFEAGGRGRAGGNENPAGQFGRLSKSGQYEGPVGEPGPWGDIDLSPDGTQVAMTRVDGTADIWILDWQRGDLGVPTRLTLDPADDMNPVWSHDGKRVAFTTFRNGNADIFVRNANGVGEDEPLLSSPAHEAIEDWAPDGSHIVYLTGNQLDATSQMDIWAMPLSGDRKPFPVLVGPFGKNEPQVSYDGRWLAYITSETGEWEVYVMSFPDGKQRVKASVGGGGQPRWSPDGKEIYYRAPAGRAMAVDVVTKPELGVSSPRLMFNNGYQPGYSNAAIRHQWSVSPDGKWFLVRAANTGGRGVRGITSVPMGFTPEASGSASAAAVVPSRATPNRGLTVVLNWPAALKREVK